MSSKWAQSQREGWLRDLYGKDNGDGNKILPLESPQAQLVNILDNLIFSKLSPKDAATETASVIMAQEDIGTPWMNLIGLCLNAAETLENQKDLQILVHYIVELASLPDAVNDGPEPKTWDAGGRKERIQPGQAVVFEGKKLWRDLPEFSWNLTESFQGPEQHLHDLKFPASPEIATTKWKNLNTFLALLAMSADAQKIPALAGMSQLGLKTLSLALEYPSGTRDCKNIDLHAPAAAQWIRIAGDELERLCSHGLEKFDAGSLWVVAGGGETCDSARLQFWKTRLAALGY